MVLKVSYAMTLIWEFVVGLYILHKLQPQMRKKSRFVKGWLAIVSLVFLGLHIVNGQESYVSNLYIIIISLEVAVFYCVFFKARYAVVFLWEMLYGINLAFLKLPVLIFFGILENKTLGQMNRNEISVGEVTWSVLINILLFILIKNGQNWWTTLQGYVTKKCGRLLFIIILQWCLLTYNMWLGEQGFQTVDLVINIIFIICTALAIQCFLLYVSYQKTQAESSMLDTTQNLAQRYNYVLEEMYKRNNSKLHDVKHNMLCIASCLERQDIDSARKYVYEYLHDLSKAENQVWTGFAFLDFIINYKKAEMDERGIDFIFRFELYESPLEEAEMGVVLGNLLDNAIEAAGECDLGNRKIYMCMQSVNQVSLLHIKNSCTILPQQTKGKFISTKKNKYAHGLGVENVKRIVERHHGSIEFQYDNEQFEVSILL